MSNRRTAYALTWALVLMNAPLFSWQVRADEDKPKQSRENDDRDDEVDDDDDDDRHEKGHRKHERSEHPATVSPADGFRRLFNGKDLTGWHKNPGKIGHGTGGEWILQDGAIVGGQDPPGSGNGGILLSDGEFGDFEVIFEVKPDWGCDSGFFLRSNEKGQCYQIMIDYREDGNIGDIYREGLDGKSNKSYSIDGVYSEGLEKKPIGFKIKPVGEKPAVTQKKWDKLWHKDGWNTIRARVEGNPPTIATWLNGHKITEYKSDKAFEGTLTEKGRIATQVHGGKAWPNGAVVRFRNIQVKEIKKSEK